MLLVQWNNTWRFSRLGTVEVIQLDASLSNDMSFENLFKDIKASPFYKSSVGYIAYEQGLNQIIEDFGNFDLKKIDKEDFKKINLQDLESMLRFDWPEDSRDSILDSAHQKIVRFIRDQVSMDEVFYELDISENNEDKIGSSILWDRFSHWVGVDARRQLIHLVTIGCQ